MQFSYSLHIKHSDKTWANRMDHYMNYGDESLDWESFIVSAGIVSFLTLVVWCIFNHMINDDFKILDTLR